MVRNMNLGVAPAVGTIAAIAASIVAKLAAGAVSHWLAVRETARQYREMQDMEEAAFRQLANILARDTDTAEWEWFQTLMKMKEYGMLAPDSNGSPDQTGQTWMAWAVIAALVISVVFVFRE